MHTLTRPELEIAWNQKDQSAAPGTIYLMARHSGTGMSHTQFIHLPYCPCPQTLRVQRPTASARAHAPSRKSPGIDHTYRPKCRNRHHMRARHFGMGASRTQCIPKPMNLPSNSEGNAPQSASQRARGSGRRLPGIDHMKSFEVPQTVPAK